MKKFFFVICACAVLFASNAFGGCTAEGFQKEVLAMQASITELSKDPEKLAALNAEIEKDFSVEMMEFAQLAQNASGDLAKTQEMLDKGCDLYGRMNKALNAYK